MKKKKEDPRVEKKKNQGLKKEGGVLKKEERTKEGT